MSIQTNMMFRKFFYSIAKFTRYDSREQVGTDSRLKKR